MNGRVRRARKTEDLLAERWRENGIAPHAKACGPSQAGKDIIDVPGLSTEVKARDGLSLPAALRQAFRNALPGELPIVVARHSGQGIAAINEWTVTLNLQNFESIWRELCQARQATREHEGRETWTQ